MCSLRYGSARGSPPGRARTRTRTVALLLASQHVRSCRPGEGLPVRDLPQRGRGGRGEGEEGWGGGACRRLGGGRLGDEVFWSPRAGSAVLGYKPAVYAPWVNDRVDEVWSCSSF